MKLLDLFRADYETIPKTFGYKINNKLLTIEDQEEALTKPYWAYLFARKVPGADIRKCEEAACKSSEWAYCFALDISGADIKKCEEAAYQDPGWAYCFAREVPGADIRKCEEACKDRPEWASWFARLKEMRRDSCRGYECIKSWRLKH